MPNKDKRTTAQRASDNKHKPSSYSSSTTSGYGGFLSEYSKKRTTQEQIKKSNKNKQGSAPSRSDRKTNGITTGNHMFSNSSLKQPKPKYKLSGKKEGCVSPNGGCVNPQDKNKQKQKTK